MKLHDAVFMLHRFESPVGEDVVGSSAGDEILEKDGQRIAHILQTVVPLHDWNDWEKVEHGD